MKMTHKYEHISTGAGFKVLNGTTETTVINQDGTFPAPKIDSVQEVVTAAALVDGTSTAGTHTFTATIPAGAIVTQTTISAVTGFTGDTSAVLIVGDGSTTNRYNTGTPNVFATAAHISAGAVSGTAYNLTAVAPVVTVTSATDITDVITDAGGSATVTVFYYTV